jgi:hypothetical protein
MNGRQRARYHSQLWPAACAAQGWNPRDQEKRREVTLQATGTASSTGLSELQITRLFDFLKHLAHPNSLDHAIPVANPDVQEERHDRRRALWAFEAVFAGFVAQLLPRREWPAGTRAWTNLPATHLEAILQALDQEPDASSAEPTPAELVARIRSVLDKYVQALASQIYGLPAGVTGWRELSIDTLGKLKMTLKARFSAKAKALRGACKPLANRHLDAVFVADSDSVDNPF